MLAPKTILAESLDRVRKGETDSYESIIRECQQDVWKVLVAMLHDNREIEDLVQKVFIEAFFNLNRYDDSQDFLLWLKGIARNLAREHLRKSMRENARMERYQNHLLVQLENVESLEARREWMMDAVHKCRGKLPDNLSAIVELRYVQASSFEQIALAMGRTVDASRQLLWRVRKVLKDCVKMEMKNT